MSRSNSLAPRTSGRVVQLATDPTPPPELDVSRLPPATGGGEPIPDEGDAISQMAAISGPAEPERRDEEESLEGAVQASFAGAPPQGISTDGVAASLGSGRPLDSGVGRSMTAFFGHDFSRIRIHTDSQSSALARSLHAQAFTVGDQVAFAAGRYRPETAEGKRLITHELTHVVQQSRGLGADILRAGIGAPGDRYEMEAERNAELFTRGVRAVSAGDGSQRQGDRQAIQLYSGSSAATYAKAWAMSTNPAYPRFPNDCTNFVSQATLAGGWTMVGGSCSDRTQNDVWWYGSSKCWWPGVRASYTWAGAQNFFNFVSASGRGSRAAHISDLQIGDVLQMAFSGTHIGHSMVVTDKRDGNVFLSYHTSDHLDRPFWGPGGILEAYPSAGYYGWNL